jgi:uncharacterized membrane protein YesL
METIITPADLQSAYLDGMWHGGLGVGLIIFGIIGWPATRYVLGVLTYPFTRRPARKPIGSAYWDKYSSPHMQTGFDFSGANLSGRKK